MNKKIDANTQVIRILHQWGINYFSGVNAGGISHITQHLTPYSLDLNSKVPQFFSINEYVAGFLPIGSYLTSGKIAGCIVTTGAATKLVSSGMSDCKLANIPAVYLIALNPSFTNHLSPLQDVSEDGMNTIGQLKAEFASDCFIIKDIKQLEKQLTRAQKVLAESRPAILLFYPDILSQKIPFNFCIPYKNKKSFMKKDVTYFLNIFPKTAQDRRVIIYVGSEAARCEHIQTLTSQFSELLQAATVWSVNGANAIAPDNPYGYGYIMFGGNDKALELWQSINENDIVITLGFDPGEYALNLAVLPAGQVWHFTHFPHSYGHHQGSIKHRTSGDYHQIRGDIGALLSSIIPQLKNKKLNTLPAKKITHFNTRMISRKVKSNCVDLVTFFEKINLLWQPNSIGFDDVCVTYKDRQYITQRPNPHIQFYSLQDGSAMGNAFGLGVGAKISAPDRHVFIFSGDGCWRLFAGALAEVSRLDLRLFIINNQSYALVKKGLEVVLPHTKKEHYHSHLENIDFVQAAQSHGWLGLKLKPDLSNLKEIMQHCYTQHGQSILIEVPTDSEQVIGLNTRLNNLKF